MEQEPTALSESQNLQQTQQVGASLSSTTQVLAPTHCPICGQANPPGETYCIECGFLLSSAAPEVTTEERVYPKLRDPVGGREYLLKAGPNLIGRDPTADVLLSDGTVSRRHAQIIIETDTAYLKDLGSTNGTRVNGQMIPADQPVPLAMGAELRFGNVTLLLELPEGFVAPEPVQPEVSEQPVAYLVNSTDPTQRFPLFARANRVGRRATNDIVLTDPYVSGQHALLEITGDTIQLTDLGSTNGTFVNGNRLTPNVPTSLEAGVAITLGQNQFTVEWASEPEEAGAEPEAEVAGESEGAAEEPAPETEAEMNLQVPPEGESEEG